MFQASNIPFRHTVAAPLNASVGQLLKLIATLCLGTAIVSTPSLAQTREPARIDGSSDSSFDASFVALVRSIKPAERRSLALGLFGALLAHECLAPETVVHLSFFPVEPKDAPAIRPCREYLHGMSYQEILEAGEPRRDQSAAALSGHWFKADGDAAAQLKGQPARGS